MRLFILLVVSFLTACENKNVSFDTLESARKQAKENAEFNAKMWRGQLPQYAQLAIISRGDSTQTNDCPVGDGWSTISLLNPDQPAQELKLKCSTVSDSIGCREEADFKASPYGKEDGQCQGDKLPFPIPKIAK